MYAIIVTGNKQYKVQPGDVLEVELINADDEGHLEFRDVLAIGGDQGVQVGKPCLPEAKVTAELVEYFRGDKIYVVKKKRRKGYKIRNGHRQELARVRILDIQAGA